MYALKVQLNDQAPIVGGANDLSVLTAILSCSGKLGPLSHTTGDDKTQDFTFRLGGLTSKSEGKVDEHLVWLENNNLKLGDIVTIRIMSVAQADAVISSKEAEKRANNEREYFNHCKRTYLDLREKYENES
jgi:hypothetical protein